MSDGLIQDASSAPDLSDLTGSQLSPDIAAPFASTGPQAAAVLAKVWPQDLALNEQQMVPFVFRPERISVGHSFRTDGVTGVSADDQIKNLGYIEIAINKVVFAGPDVLKNCETLLIWSYPANSGGQSTTGKSAEQQQVSKALPVKLTFTWGSTLNFPVHLRKVDITYTRFLPDGTPIRAEVNLSLYQDRTDSLPGTNPTSGGPAGRRTRVLDSSDRLPSVAAANYGRPAAWRQVALANGVDDPLRMKPGTVVFLPEPDELGAADGSVLPGAGR